MGAHFGDFGTKIFATDLVDNPVKDCSLNAQFSHKLRKHISVVFEYFGERRFFGENYYYPS